MLFPVAMVLMLLSWLQPMHIPPWLSWHSEQLAFLSVIFASAGVLTSMSHAKSRNIQIPKTALAPAAIMGLVALQCATGKIDYYGDGAAAIFYLSMFTIGAIAARTYAEQLHSCGQTGSAAERLLDWFACTVIIGMVASLFISLSQSLMIWEDLSWIHRTAGFRRPGGNMGQANHLATLSAIGLASAFYLRARLILSSRCTNLLTLVAFQVVAISESRTGILGVVVLIAWWYYFNRINSRQNVIQSILHLMAFGVLVWGWPKVINAVHSGGFDNIRETISINTSAGARFVVWPQLWDAILIKPWLGWGWGGVSKALNSVLDHYDEGYPFTYAHNIFLDLGIGFGLPIAISIALGVCIWFIKRLSGSSLPSIRYCFSIVIAVGIHSLTEYPHAYAYFLLPVGVAIGIIEAHDRSNRAFTLNRKYFVAILFLLASIWILSVREYFDMEEDYRISRFIAQRVGTPPNGYQPKNSVFLNQLEAQAKTIITEVRPNMSVEDIQMLQKASMRFPYYATQNRYALALALNGETKEAERQLKVMKIMHGERSFEGIQDHWIELSQKQYPQLQKIKIP